MPEPTPRRCHLILEGGRICNAEGWLHIALGIAQEAGGYPEVVQIVLCTKHAPGWLRVNAPMTIRDRQALHELGDECQMPGAAWCLTHNICHSDGEHHDDPALEELSRSPKPLVHA